MNRQIGPAHSLQKPSPPAGKPRLRLTVSTRGAGTPIPTPSPGLRRGFRAFATAGSEGFPPRTGRASTVIHE